jgi:NAD(P)-dependent dehydrogenase (short-subunit alcohol dehydrogenase family)
MDLLLEGKRAIVTGASRGIGKAIAKALAAEGVDLVIVARGQEALEAAAREIEDASGRRCTPVPADTSDDASVRAMVESAVGALGGVDILVNSAAQPSGQGPAPDLEGTRWEHVAPEMNTKAMGYLRTAQAVIPHMKAQGWGRIINIGGLGYRRSGSALNSMRNAAVHALTKNLADELGPFGINAVAIHPGLTRTEATAGVIARRAQATGEAPEAIERRMAQGNSVHRIIDASDIAYVAVMLASPRSVAVNGDAVIAGGGVAGAIYY